MSVFTLPGWAEFHLDWRPSTHLSEVNGESVHRYLAGVMRKRVDVGDDTVEIAVLRKRSKNARLIDDARMLSAAQERQQAGSDGVSCFPARAR